MTSDEDLASMIRDCVDREVLEVALPAGFAERVTAGARARRRPRRVQWSVGLAALATAAAVAAGEFVLEPPPVTDPVAGPVASPAEPRELLGRVSVEEFPEAARTGWIQNDSRADRRLWMTEHRLDGQRHPVQIRVFSGNATLEGVTAEYRDAAKATEARPVPAVSSGEAVSWRDGGLRHVVLQREPGLVIYVVTQDFGLAWPVRIAEGVRIG